MVPLTPNLKYSDPGNLRMYEEKHVFKRSNSQTEFELFNQIGTGGGGIATLLDFNDN
jgi:hypothetical protein